jgi:hypothetical protein
MPKSVLELGQELFCSDRPATDVRWHDIGSLWSPEAETDRGGIHLMRDAMPDLAIRFLSFFEAGDRATGHVHVVGTHTGAPLLGQAASGRAIEADGMVVIRTEHDRIAEVWELWNGLAIYRALGLLIEPRRNLRKGHPADHTPDWDAADEAALGSFPASDPPSH